MILLRRLIHKPLMLLFKAASKHKIKLIRSDYIPNGKPTIFAATHVFYDDVSTILCSLKKNAHVLLAIEGKRSTPSFIERVGLFLNGVVILNRGDKSSRAKATAKLEKILKAKGDALIFPEGEWNITPNLLVQKLNWGVIGIAEHAGANIVPVGVDIINGEYCVIIGDCFDYSRYETKQDAINNLRDALATLAWELISMKTPAKRSDISDSYWLKHIKTQQSYFPKKTIEDHIYDESFIYRPKDEISLGELLADLHGIKYRSMAVDYDRHKRIEDLIKRWTKA